MAAYPRKQTVVILVVCILVVGGLAFYVRAGNSGFSRAKSLDTGLTNTLFISTQEILPVTTDWRKQFLGASATSTTLKGTASASLSTPDEKLTATDLLGRAIFAKYAELRQTGLNNDSKSVESVVNQVTAANLSALPAPKKFSAKDIITSTNTTLNLSMYSKAILATLGTYMPKVNEMEIANQAITNDDMTELKKIDPIIANYKQMISLLTTMQVPIPLTQYHVDLLNSLSMALYNAESFRQVDTDPVRGLSAASSELVILQNISLAISGIHNYLTSMGVTINP